MQALNYEGLVAACENKFGSGSLGHMKQGALVGFRGRQDFDVVCGQLIQRLQEGDFVWTQTETMGMPGGTPGFRVPGVPGAMPGGFGVPGGMPR